MLSLEEKAKKEACEACVRSTSFPGFFIFLPRGEKREKPRNEVGARRGGEACVRSTSFPGFFIFLPRGRKRENPGNEVGAR